MICAADETCFQPGSNRLHGWINGNIAMAPISLDHCDVSLQVSKRRAAGEAPPADVLRPLEASSPSPHNWQFDGGLEPSMKVHEG